MKKFEVKKLGVKSLFKATIYFMIIPSALFMLVGLVFLAVGLVSGVTKNIFMGVFFAFIYPLILLGVYGVMNMLMGLIYNAFAVRFGGLEFSAEEVEEIQSQPGTGYIA